MAEFTDAMFMAHPAYRATFGGTIRRNSFRKAIIRLKERQYVIERSSLPGSFVLTVKGRRYIDGVLSVLQIKKTLSEAPLAWDGKWMILVFDIPEKRKKERRYLRCELVASGFLRMQKSVWITPHAIDKTFIDRLNTIGKLGRNIEFIVAESMSNDAKYKKLFKIDPT